MEFRERTKARTATTCAWLFVGIGVISAIILIRDFLRWIGT